MLSLRVLDLESENVVLGLIVVIHHLMMSANKATNVKEPSTQQAFHKKAKFASENTFFIQADWDNLQ